MVTKRWRLNRRPTGQPRHHGWIVGSTGLHAAVVPLHYNEGALGARRAGLITASAVCMLWFDLASA